jgi:hypothetical protein
MLAIACSCSTDDTDDVLVVGLHMVGKRMKVSSLNNNVTSFLALYLSFT